MPTPTDHAQHAGVMLSGAVIAGASVSALLIQGTWPERGVAFIVGGAFSAVAGPIFTPIVHAAIVWMYGQAGVDPMLIPADAIAPFTGFALGVVGLDLMSWSVTRLKAVLATLRVPGFKATKE